MFRRLGQQSHYRCASPDHSLISECSIPISITPMPEDTITDEFRKPPVPPTSLPEERIVDKVEIAANVANIAKKLYTIVNLVCDFTTDAVKMRESADALLDELRTRVRPFLISLDTEMCSSESLLRYNVDRANIAEHRIDWLLVYNKYQKEMRRIINELSGAVYDDLENSLELRYRGCIGRRPSSETTENLEEMRAGMQRALSLLGSNQLPRNNTQA